MLERDNLYNLNFYNLKATSNHPLIFVITSLIVQPSILSILFCDSSLQLCLIKALIDWSLIATTSSKMLVDWWMMVDWWLLLSILFVSSITLVPISIYQASKMIKLHDDWTFKDVDDSFEISILTQPPKMCPLIYPNFILISPIYPQSTFNFVLVIWKVKEQGCWSDQ